MIVSVHQPQYLPWIGYFDKIKKSDIFVILDNVQYKKREYQNRNQIRTKDGSLWLTVPVKTKSKYFQKIKEVEIDNTASWNQKHWQSIVSNYSKAEFFNKHRNFFDEVYKNNWIKLIDLNLHIINYMIEVFDIKTVIHFESEFDITTEKTDRIIDLCKKINADAYLSGTGGKNYLEEEKFSTNNIKLLYQEFKHPVYKQVYGEFMPYMSAIDLLFNTGSKI